MGKERRLGRPARLNRAGAVAACAVLASHCARLATESQLRAVPLEAPRKVEVKLDDRPAVEGRRVGQKVVAQAWTLHRCGDELRQNARGLQRSETKAVGHSLTAEWLMGGAIFALGGGGVAYTMAHPAAPDEPPANQTSRYMVTVGVAALGAALLAGATVQQLSLGVRETDLGVKELRKLVRERTCGQDVRPREPLRLTLADGKQLETVADDQGRGEFALPDDIDDRHSSEGTDRAVLEGKSDARAQTVLHLAVAATPATP